MATAQRPQQQTAVHVLTHELSFPEAPTHVSYPLTEEFDEELCSDYLARARYTRLFPARISLVPETWVLSCYRVNDSLPVPVVTATVAPAHARTPVVRVDTDAFTNLYPPQQVGWLSELVFCFWLPSTVPPFGYCRHSLQQKAACAPTQRFQWRHLCSQ
jgi:hypothetical protein